MSNNLAYKDKELLDPETGEITTHIENQIVQFKKEKYAVLYIYSPWSDWC